MASVTLDLNLILTAFGGVVGVVVALAGAIKWMYKSHEARLTESIERCQADNVKQKETNEQLTQELRELRTQFADLSYKVGYLTGRKEAHEAQ
jgi:hypothetical protein